MNNLTWLITWFCDQINITDVTHQDRIVLSTLDNPGWHLYINLDHLKLKSQSYDDVIIERTETDWIHCFLKKNRIEGYCGSLNLSELINTFGEWEDPNFRDKVSNYSPALEDLAKWYTAECNEDWEHCYGMHFSTTNDPGWSINIEYSDTELERKDMPPIPSQEQPDDWIHCRTENNILQGSCSPQNLGKVITAFTEWAKQNS